MLNFLLKDQYTLVYKDKQEIKLFRDNDGILKMIAPSNQEEIENDIRNYFSKNPFGRLLANMSPKEVSLANITSMYNFMTNVKKYYYILKEQFEDLKNKDYNALLAVRQKEGISQDKEHMKLLWFEGKLDDKVEALAIMEENFPLWCKGFNYIAIPLYRYQDFLTEIKK